MTPWKRLAALCAAGAFAVAGCTSGGGSEGTDDVAAPVPTEDEGDVDAGDAGDADDESGSEPEEPEEPEGPHGRLQLGQFIEQSPASTNLELGAVEVDANGDLLLDIEAVFRGRSQVSIAQFGVRVRDDVGNTYAFRAPTDNDRLQMRPDERMTGTLAFEGPVDPEARYLEVGFNQQGDEAVFAADDRPNQYPKFLFTEVPLPGIGLEAEAGEGGGGEGLTEATTVEVGATAESERFEGYEATVVEYTEDGQTITFSVEVVNNASRMVSLTSGNPRLDDGQDSRFRWVEPEDVPRRSPEGRVELDPGDEATVEVAFRGVISDDAESLRLRFDEVTIEGIPVPGDG